MSATFEPSIARRTKGAAAMTSPAPRLSPDGWVSSERSTVRGSSSTVVELERPRESVAVKVNSIRVG